MAKTEYAEGTPTRQGFYKARTADGSVHIAEWREHDKKEGKTWWTYVSEDPTVQKTRSPLLNVTGYAKASDYEVEAALARELTLEERIAASYDAYKKAQLSYHPFSVAIPPNRQLSIGQEVLTGSLRDCRIVALHEEGQVVTYSYRAIERKQGVDIDKGLAYRTVYWMDVLPATKPRDEFLAVVPSFRSQTYFNTQLEMLVTRMYRDGVNDNPEYQREYVWSLEDKERFLESLFTGRDLGRFIFVVSRSSARPDELFDGKQRMSTLLALFASQLPYKGVYWHEMHWKDRNYIKHRSVQFAELSTEQYSKADLLDIFLDVNAAGVPQTEEHLAKIRALRDAERAKEAELS